jgi:hypothetical protein
MGRQRAQRRMAPSRCRCLDRRRLCGARRHLARLAARTHQPRSFMAALDTLRDLHEDVAGYSRLMGVDEKGTLARLKAVRKALVDPTIAKHRGRIVKTTGDGMLVEFASAVDAVRHAVEVQRTMAEQSVSVPKDKRIEFRIGIHVGDIIIDDNDTGNNSPLCRCMISSKILVLREVVRLSRAEGSDDERNAVLCGYVKGRAPDAMYQFQEPRSAEVEDRER